MWMAGGGVKPGTVYGATDEVGLYAVETKPHPRHPRTILALLGLDHEALTFQQRPRRTPHHHQRQRDKDIIA